MGNLIPEEVLQQAHSGDPQAIAALIDHQLATQGVQVSADLRRDCLQVVLEAEQALDQAAIVDLIHRELQQLAPLGVRTVRVYGQKPGQELPLWTQQVELMPTLATAELPTTTQNPPSLDEAQLCRRYADGERDFSGSNLSEANLRGAKLSLANLQQANFTWADLREASLSHANLSAAKLNYARLANANLRGANLQGASLLGADLRGANLSWAQLTGANLTGADLTGANLLEANLLRVIMPDGTLLD